jgi:TonB family protein
MTSPEPAAPAKPPIETRIPEERVAVAASKKRVETEAPPEPVLFSKSLTHFGEPRGGPFRIVVYAFVLLAAMALVSYLLIRAGKIKIPGPAANKNAPAVSTPAPEKKSETSAPSTENPTAPQPGTPAPEKQPSAPAPSVENQTAPQSNPPAPQTQSESAPPTEAQKAAVPEPKATPPPAKEQPAPAPATSSTAKLPKARGNTEGSVEKRVMPNISTGARASMRRPVEVLIRVSVNRDGAVSNASYVSPGPGNYFARQAQRAALSWKFTPPTHSGGAERSVWMLRFNFGRENTDATATIEAR